MSFSRPRSSSRLLVAWLAGSLALCGIAACVVFNLARDAIRDIDAFRIQPPAGAAVRPADLGPGRINILVLGIDERVNERGPWRTDTLILVTLDPATQSAGLLSIPRDLWVPLPGFDSETRINTAHFIGDAEDYPGGGPALAMAAVQYNLGLPVDYYIRLNFSAFEKLIDLIGGIDVYVEQTIDDPLYPDSGIGYEPLHIDAGWQHMDGRLALKYARTRHTEAGDFERARRQQQIILAVQDKVTRSEMLPALIGQAGALVETLGESFKTDLTLDQLIGLINFGARLKLENIQMLSIGPSATLPYTTPTDPPQNVLVPVREEVRKLRDQLLNPVAGLPGAGNAARLAAEAATVRIENGTQTLGLAARTQPLLAGLGFSIASIGDAYDGSQAYAQTVILDHSNKPFTAAKLAAALDLPPTAIRSMASLGDGVDVRVVLGSDFASALARQLMQTPLPASTPAP